MIPKMRQHPQFAMTVGSEQRAKIAVILISGGLMAAAGHIPIGIGMSQTIGIMMKTVSISMPVDRGMTLLVMLRTVHYVEQTVHILMYFKSVFFVHILQNRSDNHLLSESLSTCSVHVHSNFIMNLFADRY